jgi:hypothetical protein
MSTEQNDNPELLDTILSDDSWRDISKRSQASALGALRRRRRMRVVSSVALQSVMALAALAAALSLSKVFPRRPHAPELVMNAKTPQVDSTEAASHYISEQQMLAMLPKGSCVIAEVNGVRQIVFLDSKENSQAN